MSSTLPCECGIKARVNSKASAKNPREAGEDITHCGNMGLPFPLDGKMILLQSFTLFFFLLLFKWNVSCANKKKGRGEANLGIWRHQTPFSSVTYYQIQIQQLGKMPTYLCQEKENFPWLNWAVVALWDSCFVQQIESWQTSPGCYGHCLMNISLEHLDGKSPSLNGTT